MCCINVHYSWADDLNFSRNDNCIYNIIYGARVNQHPPTQCTNVDGWCTDGILFSILVPSQVDFFPLPFLSPNPSFFWQLYFLPAPFPVFFPPPDLCVFFWGTLFSPSPPPSFFSLIFFL